MLLDASDDADAETETLEYSSEEDYNSEPENEPFVDNIKRKRYQ